MKFACDLVTLHQSHLAALSDWLKLANDLHFVGVEVNRALLGRLDVQEAAAAIQRGGFFVVSLFVSSAADAEALHADIVTAAQLGATLVQASASLSVAALREADVFAEDHGVTLAVDHVPGNRTTLDAALLKVVYNCALHGSESAAVTRELAERVVYVRCDASAVTGDEPVAVIFDVLQQAGYDGWLSVRYPHHDGLREVARMVRRAWNLVRREHQAPIVQVSLDVETKEQALELAEKAVRAGVDWLEAGTPLILGEGLHGVRALRQRYPDKPLVADLKTMDGGYLEAEMMAKAGADLVVVMGQAHLATIKAVVRAARDYPIKVMGDIMVAPDKVACAQMMEDAGVDYIIHHIGYDERRLVPASPMDELEAVVNAVSVPVQAVGGLSIEQAIQCPKYGAPLVVIGAPLAIDANALVAATDVENVLREIVRRVKSGG